MVFTADQLARMTDRDLLVVKYIIVHHTAATDEGEDIADISREEIADQGFLCVGYHAVIHGEGTIQYGRPISKVPAAALGLNTVSVDVSLEGNFQPGAPGFSGEHPTGQQIASLVSYIKNVKAKVPSITHLIGHRDVAGIIGDGSVATACPGDLLYAHLPNIRALVGLAGP